MKKYCIMGILLFTVLIIASCGKKKDTSHEIDTSRGLNIPDIELTDTSVTNYIKTFPEVAKKSAELGVNPSRAIPSAMIENDDITKIIKDNGWEKPENFYQTNAKITATYPWIMAQADGIDAPPQVQKMLEKQFAPFLQKLSDNEKSILKKHAKSIKKMFEKSSEAIAQ